MGAFVLLGLLAVAFVGGGARRAVDWSTIQAVAFESDDWGLAGFVPHQDAWSGLEREALGTGRFPAAYWNSTLEDSAMVADLCAILGSHKGRDGHAAIMQPNYVMSSLGFAGEPGSGQWTSYDWPAFPPEYDRPGLEAAVNAGISAGLWYPEFHARYHYDPQQRFSSAFQDETARTATLRGIMLFPGSEKARELGPWRPTAVLADDLDHGLAVFRRAFGRWPGAVIAPDYTWTGRIEKLWESRGLTVIQGKREQINPSLMPGKAGRIQKFLVRQLERLVHPGRLYLDRNCRFEPVQNQDPEKTVASCLSEVRRAWRAGEPAVIETHRVNFAHAESEVVATGQRTLDRLLAGIGNLPGGGPIYLTDHEIAQLDRTGASWSVRGGFVVLRNYSKTKKIIIVPAEAVNLAVRHGGGGKVHSDPMVVALEAGSSLDLMPNQSVAYREFKR